MATRFSLHNRVDLLRTPHLEVTVHPSPCAGSIIMQPSNLLLPLVAWCWLDVIVGRTAVGVM